MKGWFPFTDYDFYAYIASGAFLLAAFDYVFGGHNLIRNDWTLIQGALVVALAYTIGHVVASISAFLLELLVARPLLGRAGEVALGYRKTGRLERLIAPFSFEKTHQPLSDAEREKVLNKIRDWLQLPAPTPIPLQSVFQVSYRHARKNEDARRRMDDFRNQYGFCRNMALVFLIAAVLMTVLVFQGSGGSAGWQYTLGAYGLSVAMLMRFLKFYSAFQAEVFRTLLGD